VLIFKKICIQPISKTASQTNGESGDIMPFK